MKHITHDWEWIGLNALTAPLAFEKPLHVRLAVDIFAEYDWEHLHQIEKAIGLVEG